MTLLLLALITARICVIAADLLVLAVTLYETYATVRAASSIRRTKSASTVLLTNGALYFVVLLMLNVLQAAIQVTEYTSYSTYFTAPISSILISRLLLDLRREIQPPAGPCSLNSFEMPDLKLAGNASDPVLFARQPWNGTSIRHSETARDSSLESEVEEVPRGDAGRAC